MDQIENPTPQWLKNLQENSWQMELFISGGAIFSLFQLSDFVVDWMHTAQSITIYFPSGLRMVGLFSLMGVNLLTLGFFIHLLLRAYWIGLVCLHAVFPNGPNLKKLKFSYPFSLKKIDDGILVNQIEKLDRYSGFVFFFSIISTLIITGFAIFLRILILPHIFLDLEDNKKYPWIDWIENLLAFPIIIYFIDLILFGLFRKIKWISLIVFPYFWAYDRLTLRFLYNHPLQVYSSNINKFKSSVILIIAIAFSFYLSMEEITGGSSILDRRKHFDNLADNSLFVNQGAYMDEIVQAGEKIRTPKIQSMVISEPFLKIYIPYRKFYDTFLSDSTSMSAIVGISIDNDTIEGIEWHNYNTLNNKYLNGILGMHDIQDLPRGKHELIIFKKENALIEEDTADLNKFRRNIIFWKE